MGRVKFCFCTAFLTLISASYASFALGAPKQASTNQGEAADVEAIKKKYWAVGDEAKLGVIQDRYYTKDGRIELGVFGGFTDADPFFETRSLGGLVGYHLSEYFSIKGIAWKDFVSDSTALDQFVKKVGVRTNSNPTESYFALEGAFSPIYGKISLLGSAIIYLDFHVSLGAGSVQTLNGNYFAPSFGIGQQAFVSKNVAIGFDFRWVTYQEDILERVNTANYGAKIDSQRVYNTSVLLGAYLFL